MASDRKKYMGKKKTTIDPKQTVCNIERHLANYPQQGFFVIF